MELLGSRVPECRLAACGGTGGRSSEGISRSFSYLSNTRMIRGFAMLVRLCLFGRNDMTSFLIQRPSVGRFSHRESAVVRASVRGSRNRASDHERPRSPTVLSLLSCPLGRGEDAKKLAGHC